MSRMISASGFSRRTFLKGMSMSTAALSAGWMLPALRNVRAQGDYVPVPSAFFNLTLGDFALSVIQDGVSTFDATFAAANNVTPEEVYAVLEANNVPAPSFNATYNILLIDTGDKKVLIDTGLGTFSLDPSVPPSAGRLVPTLGLLGVAPEDITDVIITHFHPDHIAGLGDGTALTFPNAMVHMSQGEYDFLQSGPTGNEQLDGLIGLANGLLAPAVAADQLSFYDGETELIPGIMALPTPGHTPGHYAVMLNSGGKSLLNTIDTGVHWLLSLQHPEYYMSFDAIPDLAVETRIALFGRAADEQIPVLSYHFPFPGIGYIERENDAFNYQPASELL